MRKVPVQIVDVAPAQVVTACAPECAATPETVATDVQAALPLLKLLSDPNRLNIFALLTGGERCVCEIEEQMNLPQNLVSHHLGVLRDAGLIRARREGRWVHYAVNKDTLAGIYPVLCRLFNPECVNDGCADDTAAACQT